jgi:protoporphyrinogen oxidase
MTSQKIICIGAGPAGLTAAYLLSKTGTPVTVLEADPHYVGGLSRTVKHEGFHFDIGGHRFFSKSKVVEDLWNEILPDDMLVRPRSSRIYYREQFFSYPLNIFESLWKLGPLECFRCTASYLKARAVPIESPRTFEQWVSNQFGRRLFEIFFKTYTEKVWGMGCNEISADWAAQRIKGVSLGSTLINALTRGKSSGDRNKVIKSLIHSFRYPRKGPGMMWEAAAKKILENGGEILMDRKVTGLEKKESNWKVTFQDSNGAVSSLEADHVISSAPLREIILGLSPAPDPKVIEAASKLRYRDFVTVALFIKDRNVFSDNWIYIHDPSVRVGRIQNFKSWSPELIPDPSLNCYGLEYFCFEKDSFWKSPDEDLISLAKAELTKIGLSKMEDILGGHVVRHKKAYPVYDDHYAANVETIRQELDTKFPGLHLVGRNGMHKYNNQDHAMMTAMLTVENILSGSKKYDVWAVNQDAEYHERGGEEQVIESAASGLRLIPQRV